MVDMGSVSHNYKETMTAEFLSRWAVNYRKSSVLFALSNWKEKLVVNRIIMGNCNMTGSLITYDICDR